MPLGKSIGLFQKSRSALIVRSTLILCCLIVLVKDHSAAAVRGVPPLSSAGGRNDLAAEKYKDTDNFYCYFADGTPSNGVVADASPQQLPSSRINDDYCDCLDGTDEPGTSACSHVPSLHFFCSNDPSNTLYIHSSRVNDGVCDCCDGEDEQHGNRGAVSICPDTCKERALLLLRDKQDLAEQFRRGLKEKSAFLSQAEELVNERIVRKRSLETKQSSLERALPFLQSLVEVKEAKEEDYRSQLSWRVDKHYVDTIGLVRFDVEFLMEIVLPNVCINGGSTAVEMLKKNFPIYEPGKNKGKVINIVELSTAFREKVGKGGSGGNNEEEQAEADEIGFQLVGNITTASRWAQHAPSLLSRSKQKKIAHTIFLVANATDTLEYLATLAFEEWAKRKSKEQMDTSGILSEGEEKEVEERAKRLTEFVNTERKSIREQVRMAEPAQQRFFHASSALQDTREEIQLVKKQETMGFGANNSFLPLMGECFPHNVGKYTYKICMFENAQQDHTSLGKFDYFKHELAEQGEVAEMKFTGGQGCPGGQSREMLVRFSCGESNVFKKVEEPSPCSYEAQFITPALCGEKEERFVNDVDTEFAKIDGMGEG